MSRLAAPTFALLLVVSGIAVAAPVAGGGSVQESSTTPPTDSIQTAGRMVIPGSELQATGTGTVTPSLSATLASESDALSEHHRYGSLGATFAATDPDDRPDFLDSTLIQLREDTLSLASAQRQAVRGYANGTITEATLLRRLAMIHERAGHLLETLRLVEQLRQRAGVDYLEYFVLRLEVDLLALEGPVRDRIATRLAASGTVPPVHVEASNGAVVLAMLSDGRYVREAYFMENRRRKGSPEVATSSDAIDWTDSHYNWVFEHGTSLNVDGFADSAWVVRIPHTQGRLVTYLDARGSDVFREIQTLRLGDVRTHQLRTRTDGGLRVLLNRTYPGGPLRVEVYDAFTGNATEASVTLDGRELGSTGDDGTVWVVEPRTEYTVTVRSASGTVNVSVSPDE